MNDRDGFSPGNDTLNEMDTSVGNKPPQIIDETPAATSRAGTPNTVKSEADWLKRVLRQSVLVSRISVEIRTDTDKVDWDENCYKECRRLLLQVIFGYICFYDSDLLQPSCPSAHPPSPPPPQL
jgi:hypothetical protein